MSGEKDAEIGGTQIGLITLWLDETRSRRRGDAGLRGDLTHGMVPGVPTAVAEQTSNAVTEGIRITVQSLYLADQSAPEHDRYVFAYTVAIRNEGTQPAQLKTRHWVITDGRGTIEEVRGDGVVGEQPRILPGRHFQYTSGCVLTTPIGTMHGSYRMWRDDGSYFDAQIAAFSLSSPLRKGAGPAN